MAPAQDKDRAKGGVSQLLQMGEARSPSERLLDAEDTSKSKGSGSGDRPKGQKGGKGKRQKGGKGKSKKVGAVENTENGDEQEWDDGFEGNYDEEPEKKPCAWRWA